MVLQQGVTSFTNKFGFILEISECLAFKIAKLYFKCLV
jgi:hypothetical protein